MQEERSKPRWTAEDRLKRDLGVLRWIAAYPGSQGPTIAQIADASGVYPENGRQQCGQDIKRLGKWGSLIRGAGHPAHWTLADGALTAVEAQAASPLPPRFWEKVDQNGPVPSYAPHLGPCWIWTGAMAGPGEKYGYLRVDGKTVKAMRFGYAALVGPIPEKYELDHLCRVRACVRPDHLEPVTVKENGARGVSPSAQNGRKTHCKYGHPFDAENTAIYVASNGRRHRYCKQCNRDKAGAHKRHWALKRGADAITLDELLVRDGWTCGICREPIDPDACFPDQSSASLDHIVALALGGRHVWSNVQAAHWICNVRKGGDPRRADYQAAQQ